MKENIKMLEKLAMVNMTLQKDEVESHQAEKTMIKLAKTNTEK